MYYLIGLYVIFYLFFIKNINILLKSILKGTFFSVVIQLILIYKGVGDWGGVRFKGTFNNPNQLGYFAVLSGSLLCLCSWYLNMSIKKILPILLSIFVLSILSGSRSSFLSIFYLICIYLLLRKNYIILTIFCLSAFIIYIYISDFFVVSNLQDRFSGKITANKNLYEDLIERWHILKQENDILVILCGGGEGVNDVIESHNNLIAMFHGYGIFGILLLLFLIVHLMKKNFKFFLIAILPALIYGLGHNGMRSSLFYLLIGLSDKINLRDTTKCQRE